MTSHELCPFVRQHCCQPSSWNTWRFWQLQCDVEVRILRLRPTTLLDHANWQSPYDSRFSNMLDVSSILGARVQTAHFKFKLCLPMLFPCNHKYVNYSNDWSWEIWLSRRSELKFEQTVQKMLYYSGIWRVALLLFVGACWFAYRGLAGCTSGIADSAVPLTKRNGRVSWCLCGVVTLWRFKLSRARHEKKHEEKHDKTWQNNDAKMLRRISFVVSEATVANLGDAVWTQPPSRTNVSCQHLGRMSIHYMYTKASNVSHSKCTQNYKLRTRQ